MPFFSLFKWKYRYQGLERLHTPGNLFSPLHSLAFMQPEPAYFVLFSKPKAMATTTVACAHSDCCMEMLAQFIILV